MSNRLAAVCAFLLFVFACGDGDAVPGTDPRESILKGSCTACEVVAESVAFLGHPDDTVAIRQENLPAMDSRGRYYVGAGNGGAVLVFGPNGRLMTTFGKAGRGPGEFANVSEIYVDASDSILVLGGGVIHVMSPDYAHVRQYQNNGGGGGFSGTILRDGRLLRGEDAHGFRLMDSVGQIGPVINLKEIDTARCGDCERTYREASVAGSLWSGPQNAYRVEQHDLSGALLRRFVREVEWFPSWLDEPGKQPNDDMIAFLSRPRILGVRQGSDGIVWTHIMMLEGAESLKSANFDDPKGMAKILSSMITRVEGIDPVKKKLIASSKFTNVVFPLTGDISAQLIADPSGDWAWKILRFNMKKGTDR